MHEPVLPAAPTDWQLVATEGAGPFITRATYRRPDGVEVEWTSRRHRKGQGLRLLGMPPSAAAPRGGPCACSTTDVVDRGFVRRRLDLLRARCAAGYLDVVSARTDGLTFFIGSIFFTGASYLSFVEAADSPDALQAGSVHRLRFRAAGWRPRSIDWWATAIQLVGTVYFNVMTFLALYDNWSVSQENRLVWRPDVVGSICFLVASYLAWAEVCHSAGRLRFRELSWWIVALNLLGSVFFGISAIGAYVNPDTDEVTNLRWDNGGTFLGALCFLIAAVMLIPEARSARAPAASG